MKRRKFIKNSAASTALLSLSGLPISCSENKTVKITVLHTNDVHSHIDPFGPNDVKNPNKGGVSRRATLIQKGGEKKRNEIFQMAMLEPKLAILDETDSGLDIDALRIVANGVNKLKSKDNATLVITHYQRLLDYIVPDFVHVLYDGKIVKSGGKELAFKLEEKGYDWIKKEANQNA